MKKTLIYLISLVSYLVITAALTLPVHAQKKASGSQAIEC